MEALSKAESATVKRVLEQHVKGMSWEEIDIFFGRKESKGNWSWRLFNMGQEGL